MRLDEVPHSGAKDKYLSRREELGLDISAEAPFLVDPDGRELPDDAVMQHLRFARVTRLSIEANAGFCRGVLAARYKDVPDVVEKEAML
jgi:hypothetical protein